MEELLEKQIQFMLEGCFHATTKRLEINERIQNEGNQENEDWELQKRFYGSFYRRLACRYFKQDVKVTLSFGDFEEMVVDCKGPQTFVERISAVYGIPLKDVRVNPDFAKQHGIDCSSLVHEESSEETDSLDCVILSSTRRESSAEGFSSEPEASFIHESPKQPKKKIEIPETFEVPRSFEENIPETPKDPLLEVLNAKPLNTKNFKIPKRIKASEERSPKDLFSEPATSYEKPPKIKYLDLNKNDIDFLQSESEIKKPKSPERLGRFFSALKESRETVSKNKFAEYKQQRESRMMSKDKWKEDRENQQWVSQAGPSYQEDSFFDSGITKKNQTFLTDEDLNSVSTEKPVNFDLCFE